MTRLQTSSTSASRWLTKTTAIPSADRRRTMTSSASVSAWLSEAVGSSMKTSVASADERTRDRDDLPLRDGKAAERRVEVEARPPSRSRMRLAADLHRCIVHQARPGAEVALEGDVLGHRHLGKQRQVLPDHLDAEGPGRRRD